MITEHPYGWLSFVPPFTAIVLAIITKRVLLSLLLGIFFGALILADWQVPAAVGHMCSENLWNQLVDSDTQHVFFFTIVMGTMVGMINRAAGMKGLVNALTPFANNRKRGQVTTWFLGLFVFFDDYANTMLLGNTLKPLTDRLKIAREKLAYLVDSTAAPVAGLALISTWVAGEISYVQEGLDSLPVGESWNAFSIFIQSIPYRFYVLFALIFVPIVALMGRDFGPMLKAERKAIAEGVTAVPLEAVENEALQHRDPTAPEADTPARWFNAVIPIVVTVAAVIYFLYTSGSEATESKKLMDIFGEASSYSSLLWGALWGAGTAYVLIAIQRLISFKDLHQSAADGARLMVPALLVLWLAQSMSGLTKDQELDESHKPIVEALYVSGSPSEEILRYVATEMDLGNQEPAQLLDSAKMLIKLRHETYLTQLTEEKKSLVENLNLKDPDVLAERMKLVESKAFEQFETDTEYLLKIIKDPETFKAFLEDLLRGSEKHALDDEVSFCESFVAPADQIQLKFGRWNEETEKDGQVTDLLTYAENSGVAYPTFEYQYLYREKRLYTGDFLSSQLAKLREGDGLIANNFVALLPTMVFILASIVAFSTGTSWGTMGIVMPLVIPLTYSQLAIGDAEVLASNSILLCCVGSVLAGAIFGDHCSPISDTTVLSSQASGCDHVAHVRTQLPYAILVGLVAIVFGTLPIGYGVSVWILIPLGIAVMIGSLWLLGTPLEDPSEQESQPENSEK